MRRKRCGDGPIAFAWRQAESGTALEEVCRRLGLSEPGFHRWKRQHAEMGVPEIRRLRQLEDEEARLKKLVADLTLDRAMRRGMSCAERGEARCSARARGSSPSGLRHQRTAGLPLPPESLRGGWTQ